MDNLRTVLSIVLSKIPPREILSNRIQFDRIMMGDFVKLAGYYVKNYSNDELENLFEYICNEYEEQADYYMGYGRQISDNRGETGKKFSIFDAILIFAVRVLQEVDGEPVCQFEQLLRWRMTSHELDEEVFTTAFLAYKDSQYIHVKRDFSWRPVIRHNNKYLNQLLMQGMADNHFHLKGSAPQFPLSWISMMNNVTSSKFHDLLNSYSKQRLSTIYYTGAEEEHLYISYLKAALIRAFLFSRLTGQLFLLEDEEEINKNNLLGEKVYRSSEWEQRTIRLLEWLLCEKDEILFYRDKIQNNISVYKGIRINGQKILDYALLGSFYHGTPENDVNHILTGERWFMYAMYLKIYSRNTEFSRYFNMFYAYLVIKDTIRSELVQTNENIGFDNFANYQSRKEDFIGQELEQKYIDMAIRGTLESQNIFYLEARIVPRKTVKDNHEYIQKLDWAVKSSAELRNRYFYVFHFVKEKDDLKWLDSDIVSRHYQKRLNLKKQAIAIAKMRTDYPETAVRVKGIDACAKEIGCRPEVFAQVYRYLQNHIVYSSRNSENLDEEKNKKVRQLSATYHIGEDYLDIVDGLRAIEETVRFLQLDCGSRIGHALVLGVDPEEYYQIKKGRILISQQCYLDNLVWLYYKIMNYGLHGYDDLQLHIEKEYNKYFRLIYGNYIYDDFFQSTMKAARKHFEKEDKQAFRGYNNTDFHFRISEYYSAWKLRGDNPECYFDGYFKEIESMSEWDKYAVNRKYPADYRSRYNPECAYLYFLYHYCGKAKIEGEKVIEVNVTHQMIQCVKEVQREMQKWIARKGIGIETNPSSNYLIGFSKRYDKHPIVSLYNMGLETESEKIIQCPQLRVCINTDDQGIFSTYLDNEYALMTLALEKAKDENGRNKYCRASIYQWIDNVRKMGLRLSFAERRSEAFFDESE